jgi:hypothetical protein
MLKNNNSNYISIFFINNWIVNAMLFIVATCILVYHLLNGLNPDQWTARTVLLLYIAVAVRSIGLLVKRYVKCRV